MRTVRIHVEAALAPGHPVALPDGASQHLARVLRLAVGDPLVLFNGDGHDYAARLAASGKRGAVAEVLDRGPPAASESPLHLTLAQALARGEKMDWILQKATELGVARIVPVASERAGVRLDAERAERRLRHWQGVLVAACEQCGRAVLPRLCAPLSLEQFAVQSGEGLRLVLDPEAGSGIDRLPGSVASATLAIGPEGGWSERELQALRGAGFSAVRLGPRVLRTETAGLAALAVLQARFGDLS